MTRVCVKRPSFEMRIARVRTIATDDALRTTLAQSASVLGRFMQISLTTWRLEPSFTAQVADQLMAHDALGAHSRDELGMSDVVSARPVQAGLTSAACFAGGAVLPLITLLVSPASHVASVVAGTSLLCLTVLGAVSARTGGAPVRKASLRVAFWGALAMAVTAAVGRLFGSMG